MVSTWAIVAAASAFPAVLPVRKNTDPREQQHYDHVEVAEDGREPEHAGQHLIAARAVMRVQQDDFVGFSAVDLAGMAQPNHVLGVVAAVVGTHAGLAHHERLEAFAAQFLQHRRGGDIAVPLGTAFVRGVREDRRR